MKKLALTLVPLFLLAGCAATPQAELTGYALVGQGLSQTCESFETGSAIEQVNVSGEFGTEPTAEFPTPLAGSGVETKVISEGDGGTIVGAQRVALHFTGYNSGTGEQFQGSAFGSEEFIIQDLVQGATPDFCKAMTGVKVGSRIAVLLDAANAHEGNGIETLGIGADEGVLFIFDVLEAYLPKANGESKPALAGMPSVILAPSGQPGIQIPVSAAPLEFAKNALIEGRGEAIAIGDTVIVHYSGWTWQGEQFDSSWENGAPASFQVTNDSLIQGFVQALEGAKVGSQVIAVIPPELGYGSNAQGAIPANSTLIFVIDILGKE